MEERFSVRWLINNYSMADILDIAVSMTKYTEVELYFQHFQQNRIQFVH